jgi:hypothetical protein
LSPWAENAVFTKRVLGLRFAPPQDGPGGHNGALGNMPKSTAQCDNRLDDSVVSILIDQRFSLAGRRIAPHSISLSQTRLHGSKPRVSSELCAVGPAQTLNEAVQSQGQVDDEYPFFRLRAQKEAAFQDWK